MKPCDDCGASEATAIADYHLCDACYIARGSCCADEPEQDARSTVGLMMDGQASLRSSSPP